MPEDVPVLTPPTTCADTYTSIPTRITAKRWDGTEEHALKLCDWADTFRGRGSTCFIGEQEPIEMDYSADGKPILLRRPARIVISLRTGGATDMFAGDWLIQGVEDEFYPCPDSVFKSKYRPTGATPSETLRFLNGSDRG